MREYLHLEENVLHAVSIEQPNADVNAIRKRTDKLLGYNEKDDKRTIGVSVAYNILARLEDNGMIRSEIYTIKINEKEKERHFFFTTDKGRKKDSKYQLDDSRRNSTSTSEVPIFVPK